MIDFSNTEINKIKTNQDKGLLIANGLVNKSKKYFIDPDNEENDNSHLLIAGGSGSGKTTLLKKTIEYLKNSEKTIIILDFHGDMQTQGENLVSFTPTNSKNAINPFELEVDEEKGGVSIQSEAITIMLGTYFFDKGRISKKQENTLEKLIESTYNAKGIFQNDLSTWTKKPPTMTDLFYVFNYILKGGTDTNTNTNNPIDRSFSCFKDALKTINHEDSKEMQKKLKEIKNFIDSNLEQDEGSEDNLLSFTEIDLDFESINMDYYLTSSIYKSVENLYSYIEKVTKLSIFNGPAPQLTKGVNRMDLSAFTSISKPMTAKFLAEFISQKYFRSCMIRGEYNKLKNKAPGSKCDRTLIFDESKLVLPMGIEKENAFNIINRIITESRKYGLQLVLASQRLNHYSEEILSNIQTKILLGVKANDYKNAARVMAVKEDVIKNTFSFSNKRTALIENGGKCESYEIVDLA